MRTWTLLGALVVLAGVAAGCGSSASTTLALPDFAMPPPGAGCAGASAAGGGATAVPATVSLAEHQVEVLVDVCFGSSGPYPFVVDTGAQTSMVDAAVAARVGIRASGPPLEFGGVGCTGTAREGRVGDWDVAGLALAPQRLILATMPGLGGAHQPDGLLGSDVWSRFGALRVDFARGRLEVPGPEGPAPTRTTTVGAMATTAPPLVVGRPVALAPLTVTSGPSGTALATRVRFAGHPAVGFVPDTGSTQSAVDATSAADLGLAARGVAERQETVCSTITVPEVDSGRWSIAGAPLVPGALASVDLGPVSTGGAVGLLGADQLRPFGSVVFDYDGGRLVLGAG